MTKTEFFHTKAFELTSSCLLLKASIVPWDTAAFGFPVAQVDTIEIFDPTCAVSDFLRMKQWADSNKIDMIACRLPHDKLRESMFLEEQGFRFLKCSTPLN